MVPYPCAPLARRSIGARWQKNTLSTMTHCTRPRASVSAEAAFYDRRSLLPLRQYGQPPPVAPQICLQGLRLAVALLRLRRFAQHMVLGPVCSEDCQRTTEREWPFDVEHVGVTLTPDLSAWPSRAG